MTERQENESEELVVRRRRHPGRWISGALVIVLVAWALFGMFTNERFNWAVIWKYLFAPIILRGVGNTILLTVIGMVLGIVLGILVAVARLSPNPVLRTVAVAYSWLFRGVPLMVQLLMWYFLAAVIPKLGVGVPFGPELFLVDTNTVMTPIVAASLGLGLSEAAYMGEIVRSGLIAVPAGQTEAARAIGMTRLQILRRVVLPQALRVIIPPTGNEVIVMLKNTSLLIMIGFTELMTTVTTIYAQTFQNIPLLMVASFWYLVLTAVLSTLQYFIERRVGRGFRRTAMTSRSRGSRAGLKPASEPVKE